jgi:cathepsin L
MRNALAASNEARIINSGELSTYTFEQHVKDFGVENTPAKKAAFVAELARVMKHNANPKATWKETMNRFSTMSAPEMKAYKGRVKTSAKTHANLKGTKQLPSDFNMKSLTDLPASVDWRDAGVVSAVKGT